ncbi:hypothetical protein LXL04_009424 [Taraxacum kok-saghyz]
MLAFLDLRAMDGLFSSSPALLRLLYPSLSIALYLGEASEISSFGLRNRWRWKEVEEEEKGKRKEREPQVLKKTTGEERNRDCNANQSRENSRLKNNTWQTGKEQQKRCTWPSEKGKEESTTYQQLNIQPIKTSHSTTKLLLRSSHSNSSREASHPHLPHKKQSATIQAKPLLCTRKSTKFSYKKFYNFSNVQFKCLYSVVSRAAGKEGDSEKKKNIRWIMAVKRNGMVHASQLARLKLRSSLPLDLSAFNKKSSYIYLPVVAAITFSESDQFPPFCEIVWNVEMDEVEGDVAEKGLGRRISVYNHVFAFPLLATVPATKRGNGGGGGGVSTKLSRYRTNIS